MKVRALFPLAAAAGLWLSNFAAADQPNAVKANPNQVLADTIANRLRGSDSIVGAEINLSATSGSVQLTGLVRDAAQKDRIIAEVKAIAGVTAVNDNLSIVSQKVVQVQNALIPAPLAPIATSSDPIVEPAPLGASGQISPDLQAPPLPPYAWPTYAPYNNLSRVAYPQAYPYNAFPFIGPYYPFPKVPLGWRKVTLEWEDGHWYLDRKSSPHDYWKVRFQ